MYTYWGKYLHVHVVAKDGIQLLRQRIKQASLIITSVTKSRYDMATTDLGDEGNTNIGCLTAPDTFQ